MKDKQSEKQKVTLYVPHELHHKLKIRAALDCEPMSAIAERAIRFYLGHADVVDSLDAECIHGRSHQVHPCPECGSQLVMRDGELESIVGSSGILSPQVLDDSSVDEGANYSEGGPESKYLSGETLVTC